MRQWRVCAICCGPADSHHIVSRGAGGPDEEWNTINLCRMHHSECHQVGWWEFAKRYPRQGTRIVAARQRAGVHVESRVR